MTYLEKAKQILPDTPKHEIKQGCPVWFFDCVCQGREENKRCIECKASCTTCWNRKYKGEQPR